MKIETAYETDIDTRIYASDPEWSCGLEDEERIRLGVYASLSNVEESGGECPEGFPIVCNFNVVVHDPAINDGVLQSFGMDLRDFHHDGDPEKQAEHIREMLQEYGSSGVPVDDVLVNGIRKPEEDNALQALLEGLEGSRSKSLPTGSQASDARSPGSPLGRMPRRSPSRLLNEHRP